MGLSLENDTTGEKSFKKNSSPLELADTFPSRKKTRREDRRGGGVETINTTANTVALSSLLLFYLWLKRSVLFSASVTSVAFFDGFWKKIFTGIFANVSLNS
jgi:hypothetical protein